MNRSLLLALTVSAIGPMALSAASQEYTYTDLGAVPEDFIWATGRGLDVNSKGYIAGANSDPVERTAQIGIPGNGVIDTNATLGGVISDAFAIHDSDYLTGHSETSNGEFHAFLWDGADMIDLGTLGGMQSAGFAINDSGQVTGGAQTESGHENAFFWDGSAMQDIGNLGGALAYGRGISSNGLVTGIGTIPASPGEFHAFLWDGNSMQDLGTLGGPTSSGESVNVHGVVAGVSSLTNGMDHATVWDGNQVIDLGTLEGHAYSSAKSINSNGIVVGWSSNESGGDYRSFVWNGSAMTELPSPVESQAWVIKDNGAIFGITLTPSGPIHIVRWDPVDPSTQEVMIDIKPGQKKNKVNPLARGRIWVAVLSATDPASPFDPLSQVDISTVAFGPDGASPTRRRLKDVTKDGLPDLLLQFKIQDTGIVCGNVEARLTGATYSGQPFAGVDSLQTVGCKRKRREM